MQGKTVVMTGASSGLGRAAAERLAAMGARIVAIARDRQRGAALLQALRRFGAEAAHRIHYGDLSELRDLRALVIAIRDSEPRIDILVNNAGALFTRRRVSSDGFEKTFATNHLAYFVLTLGLLDRVLAAAPSRIVNTASAAHMHTTLDFDDLQLERGYGGYAAYKRSKLCNILFTRELARRLAGTGVVANAFHPGFVASRFGDESGGMLALGIAIAKRCAGLSPQRGADTLVYLACAPEAGRVSGKYFYRCRPIEPSPQASNDADAARLWSASERLAERTLGP